jgi:hypothetical protein
MRLKKHTFNYINLKAKLIRKLLLYKREKHNHKLVAIYKKYNHINRSYVSLKNENNLVGKYMRRYFTDKTQILRKL